MTVLLVRRTFSAVNLSKASQNPCFYGFSRCQEAHFLGLKSHKGEVPVQAALQPVNNFTKTNSPFKASKTALPNLNQMKAIQVHCYGTSSVYTHPETSAQGYDYSSLQSSLARKRC